LHVSYFVDTNSFGPQLRNINLKGTLTTKVTYVNGALPTLPVISRHPCDGKIGVMGRNLLSPYPPVNSARGARAGASSRRPSMVSFPRTPRHQGHFISSDPSGKTKPAPPRAKITTPLGHGMVNRLPSSFPRLKSEAPGLAGDFPLGSVTGQEAIAA
jgi:hypothetical protein